MTDAALIKITDVIEHDDGSATVKMDMDPEIYGQIFSYGFISLLRKGIEADKDAQDIRPFDEEERKRAAVRSEKNGC